MSPTKDRLWKGVQLKVETILSFEETLCVVVNLLTRCVQGCTRQSDCPAQTACEGGGDGQRFCRAPESVMRFSDIVLERATVEGPVARTGCASAGAGDLSWIAALVGGLSLVRRRRS